MRKPFFTKALFSFVVVLAHFILPETSFCQSLYTYTKIADTSGAFESFSNPFGINGLGEVVFEAQLAGGVEEVHVGDGVTSRTVVSTTGEFSSFVYPPDINDNGLVVVSGTLDAGGDAIQIFDTVGGSTPIADTSGGFSSLVAGNINNSGTIAYLATLDAGGREIWSSNGVSSTLIAYTTGAFDNFQSGSGINDSGVVSFWASLDAIGAEVWTGDGTNSTLIISSTDPGVTSVPPGGASINSVDKVVFSMTNPATGDEELRIGDGLGPSTLITSGGNFTSGGPGINDLDVVAFTHRNTARPGLFTSLDLINPVVEPGGILNGKTVVDYDFATALNNANQVAFRVWFTDGSEAIYRATAIPEASSLLLCGLAAGGFAIYRWRRKERAA